MLQRSLFFAALLVLVSPGFAAASFIDGVNTTLQPVAGVSWQPQDVGWAYSASFTYSIMAISTHFDPQSSLTPQQHAQIYNRNVTVEVYLGDPTLLGNLIASAVLNPANTEVNGFSTATFTSPLVLQAGQSYFVGFRNVMGLGVNFTIDPGAVALLPHRTGQQLTDNYDSSVLATNDHEHSQPIIGFGTNSLAIVPEPSAFVLAGIAAAGLVFTSWRRRTKAGIAPQSQSHEPPSPV